MELKQEYNAKSYRYSFNLKNMDISQRIIDYAIWYYLKYYPSIKKLRAKLLEKFWPNSENGKKYWGIWEQEIDYIINERLQNIIAEDEVIKSKIRLYKSRWKSKSYIMNKLYERQEPKELIELYLEEAFLEWEQENLNREYDKIKDKYEKNKVVEKLLRKWFRYDDIKRLF